MLSPIMVVIVINLKFLLTKLNNSKPPNGTANAPRVPDKNNAYIPNIDKIK